MALRISSHAAAFSRRGWREIARFAVLAVAVFLLSTCSDRTPLGPGAAGTVRAGLDLTGLLRAPGDVDVPVDTVLVELRRVSDSTVAVRRFLDADSLEQAGTDSTITIRLDVPLNTSPEDFYLYIAAIGGGTTWYEIRGRVTAASGAPSQTPPLIPVYVGPGAGATAVQIDLVSDTIAGGDSLLVTATVFENAAVVPGVPVGFRSSDTTKVNGIRQASLNSAWVQAPAALVDSVDIIAETPTGLTTMGRLHFTPAPAQLVMISGNNQSVAIGTQAAAPLVVQVRDQFGNPYPLGALVRFTVTGTTGSTVSPDSVVTGLQGLAQTTLTAGTQTGGLTVDATAAGLAGSPVAFSATVTSQPGQPASVVAVSPVTQTDTVNQAVPQIPTVEVRDGNSTPVPGVQVVFTVTAGGGTATGTTVLTNSSGRASVGSWTLGQSAGGNTLSAAVTGLTPVVFSATGVADSARVLLRISGDSQTAPNGTQLPNPLVVEARDQFANVVANVPVTWSPANGSVNPASSTTDAAGRTQTSWTLGTGSSNQSVSVSAPGVATPAVFNATATFASPSILLSFIGTPGVGIGLTASVEVRLTAPAGAGGVSVAVTSDDQTITTVSGSPALIPQGVIADTLTVQGVALGTTTIRGNATGYVEGTLAVDVQDRSISLPINLNVPYGQTASLPIQLASPAPAGGVTFTVSSSAPGFVGVATPTVFIAAGALTANATLNGVLPGPATVSVSNPAYSTGTSSVTTTASLNIVQTSALLNQSFGATVTINFESNGLGVAAPSPGITVTMVPRDPACLAASSPVTIATGLVSTTSTLTYGGSAALPCTTTLVATSPNLQPDSIGVTVNPVPALTVNVLNNIGSGLMTTGSVSLGATNHGGITVTVSSSDPAVALVSPSSTVVGSASIQVVLPSGQGSFSYYIHAVEGQTGPVTITADAPGFSQGSRGTTVVQPGVELIGVPATTTTLSNDNTLYAQVGVPNGQNSGLAFVQNVRPGYTGGGVTVTFVSDTPAVATLADSAGTGTPKTAVIVPGLYYTPTTIPTGGVALHPVGQGVATLQVSAPGFLQMSSTGIRGVTVTQPGITVNSLSNTGSGLTQPASVSLGASNHGGVTVTVATSDPSIALVSPNATTPGTDTIQVFLANGQSSFSYYVQGLEGATGTVSIDASAPGFGAGAGSLTIVQPGVELIGVPGTTTTLSNDNTLYAQVGVPNGQNTGLAYVQNLRPGSPGGFVTVTFVSDTPAVATLVDSIAPGTPKTARIVPGLYYTPTSIGTGGVSLRPVAQGVSTIQVSAPGYLQMSVNGYRTVSVTQPGITVNSLSVTGAGLMTGASVSLGATNHGGVTVTVTSSDPAIALVAPDATTPGTASIQVPVANGSGSFSYYVQGVEDTTGISTITASAPGFSPGNRDITIVQPGVEIQGLASTITTLSPDNQFYAQVGVMNGQQTALSYVQNVRPGIPGGALTVSFTSGTPAVATLVDTLGSGSTRTARIVPGLYYTPVSVASGGVALSPRLVGSTLITAAVPGFVTATTNGQRTVTVTQPGITLSGLAATGAGLQAAGNVSLGASNHGGVLVTVKSSNPGVVLVSPNFSTPGTDSIQVTVPNGSANFSYYIQGMEGSTGTVTITATASGFTNGTTTATIVQPAIEIQGLSATATAGGADNAFYAQVGVPNAQNTGLSYVQNVRAGFAGGGLSVTFTSSNVLVGTLVNQAGGTGSPQNAVIVPGLYYTPVSVATGGVAFRPLSAGTVTVSAAAGGAIQLPTGIRSVTVQ